MTPRADPRRSTRSDRRRKPPGDLRRRARAASRGQRRRVDDRGSITAEFAVAMPAIVLVLLLGVGVLGAGARQIRLQDAAADAARLVARGDDPGRAHAVVGSAGGTAAIEPRGDLVCVVARAPAPLSLPLPDLTATSCALAGGL